MNDLKDRTKQFALNVIKYCIALPNGQEMKIISNQLMRCSSSVGANYRAACRAKSKPDFIAKMSIVEEEADEAIYWMEMLEGLGRINDVELHRLMDEGNQLVAIMVASKKSAKGASKKNVS